MLNFQADLVLIKMGPYWPNFSLVFLIHLLLYAGVYLLLIIIIKSVFFTKMSNLK